MKKVILLIKNQPTIIKVITLIALIIYLPLWFLTINLGLSGNYDASSTLPVLGSDSQEYFVLSNNLLKTGNFSLSGDHSEYFRVPGYPFFIASVKYISSSYFFVTLIQIILVLISGYLIYRILIGTVSKKWAIFCSIIFLMEPALVLHSLVLLSDVCYLFLITLSIYLLITKKQNNLNIFIIGLILGISVLFRPISVYLLLLYFCWYVYFFWKDYRKIIKKILILSLGFFLVILPWMWRNYNKSGYFIVSTISSYNLFYYNIPMFLSWQNGLSEEENRSKLINDFKINEKEMQLPNSSKVLNKVSLEILKTSIIPYSYFHLSKTKSFFFGSSLKVVDRVYHTFHRGELNKVTSSVNLPNMNIRNLVFNIERIFWLFIFLLSFLSIFNEKRRAFSIFCFILILYFALLTGPVSYARYRLPAEIFLFLTIPFGFDVFLSFIEKYKHNSNLS